MSLFDDLSGGETVVRGALIASDAAPDAGTPVCAPNPPPDAGLEAGGALDAGTDPEAGTARDAGMTQDAGIGQDAGSTPPPPDTRDAGVFAGDAARQDPGSVASSNAGCGCAVPGGGASAPLGAGAALMLALTLVRRVGKRFRSAGSSSGAS